MYIIETRLSDHAYVETSEGLSFRIRNTEDDETLEVLVDNTLPKQEFAAGAITLAQYETDVLGHLIATLENIV